MKLPLKHIAIIAIAGGFAFLQACKDENGKINIFTIQDDRNFGAQVSAEFEQDPKVKIIDSASNVALYKFVYDMRNAILNSGKVTYKNEFPWRIRVIKDDTTLNAFCTPGGYIYVYTGLIKFLDGADELAGVMGHEIAHADRRHSTEAMTRQYGLQTLIDIVFGQDKGQLARIAAGLASLKYSRNDESQADEYSVIYLYPTTYNAYGAAGFFEKIIAMGGGSPPQFLSTHPNPDNRVAAIKTKWTELGGKTGQSYKTEYQNFKALLP